jgi:hypothetical protein
MSCFFSLYIYTFFYYCYYYYHHHIIITIPVATFTHGTYLQLHTQNKTNPVPTVYTVLQLFCIYSLCCM